MIGKTAFKFVRTILRFFITTEFFYRRYQLVGISFIIIYLCSFKPHIIYTNFFCKFFYIFYLMFVWFYNKKLKNDKWSSTFQFSFPFHYILCSLDYFAKLAADTILLIYFLRGAINRNDQSIQTAFNCSSGIVFI